MASGLNSGLNSRLLLFLSAIGVTVIGLAGWAGYSQYLSSFEKPSWRLSHSSSPPDVHSSLGLGDWALEKIVHDARPIFGDYENVETEMSTWMSAYPDKTRIVHMNIPGTHDTATWNYSVATRNRLQPVTSLVNGDVEIEPDHYRCQDNPIIDMLNAGIRAFDLRYAFDITNTSLVFWHGPALQSQTATLESVLFGFYQWLDDHPSETVLLSLQYEASPNMGNVDAADVQLRLYQTLTSPTAKSFIQQKSGKLGTLGEARGKVILLRRFDLNLLPSSFEKSLPGVHFSPKRWIVNGANTTLRYNPSLKDDEGTAYIQDYYSPLTADNSTVEENIQSKLTATTSHLRWAASPWHQDALFWSFASSTNIENTPPVTPRMQALGDGSKTPDGGVNQRLLEFLRSMKGQRLGIVMFDFFEQPQDSISTFLNLRKP